MQSRSSSMVTGVSVTHRHVLCRLRLCLQASIDVICAAPRSVFGFCGTCGLPPVLWRHRWMRIRSVTLGSTRELSWSHISLGFKIKGLPVWKVDKEAGGHLTNFWVYCVLDNTAPTASKVQYGCTSYAKVNRTVPAYVLSKTKYASAANSGCRLQRSTWQRFYPRIGKGHPACVTTSMFAPASSTLSRPWSRSPFSCVAT